MYKYVDKMHIYRMVYAKEFCSIGEIFVCAILNIEVFCLCGTDAISPSKA